MKVQATVNKVEFNPITVQFTIESKQEFNTIYQLGNYGSLVVQELNEAVSIDEDTLKKFLYTIWKKLDDIHSDGILR